MDTTVAGVGAAVVAALTEAGYMESTIGQYRKSIRFLGLLAEKQGGAYTPALGAEFAAMTTSPRTGRFSAQRRFDYGRLVHLFDSYVLSGAVDLSTRTRPGRRQAPRSTEFTDLLAGWSHDMEQRGLADSTRRCYGSLACEYLTYLEANGVTSLDAADGATVLGFLESLRDRWAESTMWSVVCSFRPFLKHTRRVDLIDAVGLANAKRRHEIMPVLTSEQEEMVIHACRSGVVSARDAAITLLALTTGLRACDIRGLRLADVDWRSGALAITQQKTGNPLTLPLPSPVLANLAEYVLHERPASDDDRVFLRLKAPHVALADHASIYVIITRTFRTSGVDGVKVGTRALRYNAASKLLRAGTPLPTIAAVLGHARPDSTNVYLSADVERLRSCALPLPERELR